MTHTEMDALLAELVLKDAGPVFQSIKVTRYPESYRAMFAFCAKTDSLKIAILDCHSADNRYAFKALYRCFCEHYLRFMYIWTRFLKEGTDSVGTDYVSFCGAVELQDYAAAVKTAGTLLGSEAVSGVDSVVSKLYPKASGMGRAELEAASDRFRYRKILKYLAAEMPGVLSSRQPFLARIVPDYALLSSFVHGGPWSDFDMTGSDHPRAIEQDRVTAELVVMMTASVLLFTAMAVSREFPEHAAVAAKVQGLIRGLSASENDA